MNHHLLHPHPPLVDLVGSAVLALVAGKLPPFDWAGLAALVGSLALLVNALANLSRVWLDRRAEPTGPNRPETRAPTCPTNPSPTTPTPEG